MNVYDFDGTIYDGDSTIDFYLFALKKHPMIIRYLPKQLMGFIRYGLKQIDKTELKEDFFSFLKSVPAEELVKEFWKQHSSRIFRWYLDQQSPDDIIVSASPEFLLRSICQRLGIQYLVTSDVEPADGHFRSRNCYGNDKVQFLYCAYPACKIDRFYSDSQSDLPLAKLADEAYLVRKGKVSRWEIPADVN